jgi:transcriptional antiterminator RfaH
MNPSDSISWHAIRTHLKQEARASNNLLAQGVEVVFPKINDCRCNEFSGAPIYTTKPLFPRYIFAHFSTAMLHNVRFTRGVQSVVGFGNHPARVDDEVISIIKSRMQEGGLVNIEPQFTQGDEVRIKDGLFRNFIGIFERTMGSSERVMIMLNTINYQVRVSIETSLVAKHP